MEFVSSDLSADGLSATDELRDFADEKNPAFRNGTLRGIGTIRRGRDAIAIGLSGPFSSLDRRWIMTSQNIFRKSNLRRIRFAGCRKTHAPKAIVFARLFAFRRGAEKSAKAITNVEAGDGQKIFIPGSRGRIRTAAPGIVAAGSAKTNEGGPKWEKFGLIYNFSRISTEGNFRGAGVAESIKRIESPARRNWDFLWAPSGTGSTKP